MTTEKNERVLDLEVRIFDAAAVHDLLYFTAHFVPSNEGCLIREENSHAGLSADDLTLTIQGLY